MLVSRDETWVPPIEYRDHELYFLYEQPIAYKYTICLHAAVLLTTGRNPGPIGVYQMAVSTIGLFVGAIINANIFGELAVLAAQLGRRSTEYQTKITQINTTIDHLKITERLGDNIRDYIITNTNSLEGQAQMSNFMRILSPSIKAKVIKHEFYHVVKRQTLFGFDARITAAVLDKLSLNLFQPDEKVTSQGNYPNKIYFLVRGRCEAIKVLSSRHRPLFMGSLHPGTMFGEIAAVLGCRSSATVLCKNYCTIAALQIEDYFIISSKYPRLSQKMEKRISANYKDPVTDFFLKRYKRIDYLANLDYKILQEISLHLKVNIYQTNQMIFEPGAKSDHVYLIYSGAVEIFIKAQGEMIALDYLGRGSVIAAYSCISDDAYTIGARAIVGGPTSIL